MSQDLTPFELTPAVAGRIRWVTTSVVRFDPEGEWPAELELTLTLQPGFATYDGRARAANQQTAWQFKTPPLSMRVGRVTSALASRLTDRTWSAWMHPLAAGAVESPPDAQIELKFSADVASRIGRNLVTAHRGRRNG